MYNVLTSNQLLPFKSFSKNILQMHNITEKYTALSYQDIVTGS